MNNEDFDAVVARVARDRERGASALACAGLRALADAARSAEATATSDLLRLLDGRAETLAVARPSMTPLYVVSRRWQRLLAGLGGLSLDAAARAAVAAADTLIADSEAAVGAAAEHAAAHIGAGTTVFTHSLSATVLATLQLLREEGETRVIVTEGRPLNEGHLVARTLAEAGMDTVLVTDAEAGLFVGKADAVLVGADTILPDGTLINKAGTFLVALAARELDVPFYVAAESFKRRPPEAGVPPLEEMAPDELGAPTLPHLKVRNVYFDITPADLISAWIDETGTVPNGTAREADGGA